MLIWMARSKKWNFSNMDLSYPLCYLRNASFFYGDLHPQTVDSTLQFIRALICHCWTLHYTLTWALCGLCSCTHRQCYMYGVQQQHTWHFHTGNGIGSTIMVICCMKYLWPTTYDNSKSLICWRNNIQLLTCYWVCYFSYLSLVMMHHACHMLVSWCVIKFRNFNVVRVLS